MLKCALLLALLLSWPAWAEDSICDPPPKDGAPMAEWSEHYVKRQEKITLAAQNLYAKYLASNWSDTAAVDALGCQVDDEIREQLGYEMQAVFWKESLNKLRRSGGGKAKLAELIDKSQFQMFRLIGHFKTANDGKGGFHRGRRSIFMDFTKIPPEEWLVILVHELAHNVDSVLKTAVDSYGDLALAKTIGKLSIHTNAPHGLSASDRAQLDRWLVAALDRGLLAEVRAWTITFALYREGLKDGTFKPIAWLDDILKQQRSAEKIAVFAFRYLDPRFTDSNEKPFDRAPISEELCHIRNQLRGASLPVVFGPELKQILDQSAP